MTIYQDNKYFDFLARSFSKVEISKRVYDEVHNNKYVNLEYFEDKDHLNQILADLKLESLITSNSKDSEELLSFIRRFGTFHSLPFKETDGEFFSAALALFLSRMGTVLFSEDLLKITFITDDAKADDAYMWLFKDNHIGPIIDSADLLTILYLKGIVTLNELISFIQNLINLYMRDLRIMINEVDHILKDEKKAKNRAALSALIETATDLDYESLQGLKGTRELRILRNSYPKIELMIDKILKSKNHIKIPKLKKQLSSIKNGILMKP